MYCFNTPQGSLSAFVARQVDLLRPRRVFLGHHDAWLPGFSRGVDVKPIRDEIARVRLETELVETGYGAAFPLFEGLRKWATSAAASAP